MTSHMPRGASDAPRRPFPPPLPPGSASPLPPRIQSHLRSGVSQRPAAAQCIRPPAPHCMWPPRAGAVSTARGASTPSSHPQFPRQCRLGPAIPAVWHASYAPPSGSAHTMTCAARALLSVSPPAHIPPRGTHRTARPIARQPTLMMTKMNDDAANTRIPPAPYSTTSRLARSNIRL